MRLWLAPLPATNEDSTAYDIAVEFGWNRVENQFPRPKLGEGFCLEKIVQQQVGWETGYSERERLYQWRNEREDRGVARSCDP